MKYAACCVVFFICCPVLVSAIHNPRRVPITGAEARKKKALCMENIDNGLWGWHCKSSAIQRENCGLRCVSATCYEKIYGDDPLEEGEIDFKRGREFQKCTRNSGNQSEKGLQKRSLEMINEATT